MNSSNFRIGLLLVFIAFMGCEKGAPPPELKDKIVYLCGEDICVINPDGTDPKVIVPSEKGGPFSNPQWSPDKREIAFTGRVEGYARVMLVDSDGSHKKVIGLPEDSRRKPNRGEPYVVLNGYDFEFLEWSPSGKYVLYKFGPVIDATRSGAISIKGKVVPDLLGLSPKLWGRDLLLHVPRGQDIYIWDLRTKQKRNLTNTEADSLFFFHPVLSPNGKMIAFQSIGPSENALWIMNCDGSEKRKLAIVGKDFQGKALGTLSFSPDAKKIMFISDAGNASQAYVINTDGTGLKGITDRIVLGTGGADWSPDGKRIVFISNKDGNNELYTINADGTGLRRLTNNSIVDCCPDW
jgi:Tol biopolymer transport system component